MKQNIRHTSHSAKTQPHWWYALRMLAPKYGKVGGLRLSNLNLYSYSYKMVMHGSTLPQAEKWEYIDYIELHARDRQKKRK